MDARAAFEKLKRDNERLRSENEKLTRKNEGLAGEVLGLQRSRDRWKQRAEEAEQKLQLPQTSFQLVELRKLAEQAVFEAQVFGGPGAVAAVPVSAFAELLLPPKPVRA